MASMEKVRPLAEKVYAEAKASGLTLKEFRALAEILTAKVYEIQSKKENEALAEQLQ